MALSLLLDGPAGQLTVWLRDSLGLALPAIALTITLGAGATVPAQCLLPQPAAFSTPLRAGAERTVLVQCRDAFGNPAPRGRDRVAMLLTARGLPTIVARCDAAADGVHRLSNPKPNPNPNPNPNPDPNPNPNPDPNPNPKP